MSRCFPYPPPGYALSRASKDALIESIKLQNADVKSKEQRKEEKKREKKEKQKKKEKAKHKLDKSNVAPTQFGDKLAPKLDHLFRKSKTELEQQLERSIVTEEYGKPMCLCSTSSDSTEHSAKRKRNPSPVEDTRGRGRIIRLRVPLKKPSQSSAPANERNEQVCSTSRRPGVLQTEDVTVSKNEITWVCSTSQPETPDARKSANADPISAAVLTPMKKLELQYIDLMDRLVPPQRRDLCLDEADDLDWLMKSKNSVSTEKKGVYRTELPVSCGSRGLWPSTQYLKDVGVCALPFTIPY